MSITHFIQESEKGFRSPVYVLYADDPYLLKEASLIGARTVPEGEKDFSLTVFDLDGIDEAPSLSRILDVANTVPFMSQQRVVIVENCQELGKTDLEMLGRYIAEPSPYTVLMLFHRGTPKSHFKELLKKVRAVPLDIRPQELSFWVLEKARQKGLEMTTAAIEYLVGAVGPDVGLISSELEKFTLIGKRSIDTGDIAGIVKGHYDYDAFDLVNALRDKDPERVFRVARGLQETQESYGLLGAINWHYSRMSSKDRGREEYYRKVFELLNETDISIKSSGGTYPLEYLLVKLLRI
ncbi:MAG TPA: DNA polymerase III subunit delta [Thermodesulfovibrionales bacterium]|nr:DNA polymerase III subunit delta [Thermodesulfovibrionales bacterium]